jgi:hypothetical protein
MQPWTVVSPEELPVELWFEVLPWLEVEGFDEGFDWLDDGGGEEGCV